MDKNRIIIITDQFYDTDSNKYITRGSCNLLLNVCKYIKKKYGIQFNLVQMAKYDFKKYKYPFNIIGVKCKNMNDFMQTVSQMPLKNVHYNNIDLLINVKNECPCTSTIHTNYYLDSNVQIPDDKNLKRIFVVNNKYLSIKNSKLYLIKNGVDVNFFRFKQRKSLNNPITLFFPNIPTKNKNLEFALALINSLNSVKSKFKFKLLVAGMYGEQGESIQGVGILNRKQMKYFYNTAHFSIIPSLSESCSLCLLESMACGTVPLVNDVDGMKEYVHDGETGIVSSVSNKSEWIKKILLILQDEEKYNHMRYLGRKSVEEKYNICETAEAYYDEWKKLFKFK